MFRGETGIGKMLTDTSYKGTPFIRKVAVGVVTLAFDVIQGQLALWFIVKIW